MPAHPPDPIRVEAFRRLVATRDLFPGPIPTIAQLARAFGISPGTGIRWLKESSTAPEIAESRTSDRRTVPSEALVVEFLLDELHDARERIADLEALALRTGWRLVS